MRHLISRFILPVLIIVFLTNCSKDSTSSNGITEFDVLVLSNYPEAMAWIDSAYTANMTNINITTMDIDNDTASVAFMRDFHVVLLFEDGLVDNAPMVGDSLYQFVMSGGNLLLSTFYWQDRSDGGYGGSWGDLEMIDPLYGGSCRYEMDTLGTTMTHTMTSDIDSLQTYYRGGPTTLRAGATSLATWSNGDILIAYNKPAGTITAVTTYPAEPFLQISQSNLDVRGDYFKLWENTIKWTGSQKPVSKPNAVISGKNRMTDKNRVNAKKTDKKSGSKFRIQ
ncbi:MAG: hypothetical protein AB7T22_14050 [Calditrichaceae bacterium]